MIATEHHRKRSHRSQFSHNMTIFTRRSIVNSYFSIKWLDRKGGGNSWWYDCFGWEAIDEIILWRINLIEENSKSRWQSLEYFLLDWVWEYFCFCIVYTTNSHYNQYSQVEMFVFVVFVYCMVLSANIGFFIKYFLEMMRQYQQCIRWGACHFYISRTVSPSISPRWNFLPQWRRECSFTKGRWLWNMVSQTVPLQMSLITVLKHLPGSLISKGCLQPLRQR